METIIFNIDITGSFVLAVSGALIAMRSKLDPFGILIVSFIAAVGGGTLRDVLLSRQVFWLQNNMVVYTVFLGSFIAMVFKDRLRFFDKPMFLYDALGLGLFTITGVQIGMDHELSIIICVLLGTVTGCFGGVFRDIILNRIPVVFKEEIYATASIFGGVLYYILVKFEIQNPFLQLIPIVTIVTIRLIAVKYNISLPNIYKNEDTKST